MITFFIPHGLIGNRPTITEAGWLIQMFNFSNWRIFFVPCHYVEHAVFIDIILKSKIRFSV